MNAWDGVIKRCRIMAIKELVIPKRKNSFYIIKKDYKEGKLIIKTNKQRKLRLTPIN